MAKALAINLDYETIISELYSMLSGAVRKSGASVNLIKIGKSPVVEYVFNKTHAIVSPTRNGLEIIVRKARDIMSYTTFRLDNLSKTNLYPTLRNVSDTLYTQVGVYGRRK